MPNCLPDGTKNCITVKCIKDRVKPDKYQNIDELKATFRMVMAEEQSIELNQAIEIKYWPIKYKAKRAPRGALFI